MTTTNKYLPHGLPEFFTSVDWKALASSVALTHPQSTVARLIYLGLPNPEIARSIGLSRPTVGVLVQAVLRRLEINKRFGVPVVLVVHVGRAVKHLCDRIGCTVKREYLC